MIHVADNPGFAILFFRGLQLHVAVSVIFDLITPLHQSVHGIDASDSDVGLVATLSPSVGCEAPAHNKERGVYLILIENTDEAGFALIAKENIWSRPIVKGECDQLLAGESRQRYKQ